MGKFLTNGEHNVIKWGVVLENGLRDGVNNFKNGCGRDNRADVLQLEVLAWS